MFQPLDPLLHSELRLAVMSLLISADEAEFPYIKEQTGATATSMSRKPSKASVPAPSAESPTRDGRRSRHTSRRLSPTCPSASRKKLSILSLVCLFRSGDYVTVQLGLLRYCLFLCIYKKVLNVEL